MSLPTSDRPIDWHALVIGAFLAISAIGTLAFAGLAVLLAASTTGSSDSSMPLTLFLLGGGLFFSVLLLIPGIYLNGRRFFNLPELGLRLPAISDSALFITLVFLWVLTLTLGQAVSSLAVADLVLPVLNVMAVGIPVILFLRIALRKLETPPAQYQWSVFGITLVVGPIAGILLEGLVFLVFMVAIGLYASFDRELAAQIKQLAEIYRTARNPDTLVASTAPILFSPIGMLAVLGLFSVAVPAIEEAVKVSALWLFAGKLKSPAQGFALGVLCGAAFALAENLGFSSTGASDWVATASLRASSALPHMLNTGILGWALVSAWQNRAYLRLAAAYTAVMLIHGTWNAISIALWLNSLLPYGQHIPDIVKSPVPFLSGWIVMIIGTLAGLGYCNRVLRRGSPVQLGYNEPLSSNSGENHGSENTD